MPKKLALYAMRILVFIFLLYYYSFLVIYLAERLPDTLKHYFK